MNIKQDYKHTPVGVIPKDWGVEKLGDIGEFKNGINKSKDDFGFGVPFINLNDIFDLDIRQLELVNASENEIQSFDLIKGDVLFVRSSVKPSGVGLTKVIDVDLNNTVYSGFIIRFRSNQTLDLNYKKYCFYDSYFRSRLLSKSTISANTNINQVALKSLKLPIPPLAEQTAIADCLSTWDSGIEKLSALITAKKEQKKGLMQQLLTGKKRLDGFTEEWDEVRLGKYFKERNQRGFNDLDLLSIGEEGVYPQSDSNKKDTSNADKSKYKLIEIGDLGYNTMRLWQGRIALSNIRGIVSPAYTILIPKIGKVNSNYFSYLFKMPFVVNKFYRSSQGMVSDTLTCRYNDFKKIKLIIPSIEEQVAIAQVIITTDKEIELLEQKLASFKMQKKGLMQVLLTGEKRLVRHNRK